MNNKFNLSLNAILYCLWLGDIKFAKFINNILNTLFSPISKYVFTKNFKRKYHKNWDKQQNELDGFLYNKRRGFHIGQANYTFGYLYSCYSSFLSFILLGFVFRFCGEISHLSIMALFAIPIGVCYIPAYKAVYSKDHYLKYFRQFEKKDEQWHKKWKRRTIAFCCGAIFMTGLGIGAIGCILLF